MTLSSEDLNRDVLARLAEERGGAIPAIVPPAQAPTHAPVPPLKPDAVSLGTSSDGAPLGIDLGRLLDGRLLIQGNSGAGKSMLLRRLFEQAFGRVQQLLVDPDGEFTSLAEVLDVVVLTAADVRRVGGETFAFHLREHRYSAVLDLSDATSEERLSLVADLVTGLIAAPEAHWHPLLLLVDEAQTIAPHSDIGDVTAETRKRAIGGLADFMGRGRKRGLAGIIATQRLAETAKAVVAKAGNVLVGRTIFDRDLERAGALLGFTVGHSRALRTLADGEFMGIGPALAGPRRVRFRTGPCRSRHKGAAPAIQAPPAIGAAAATALLSAVAPAVSTAPPEAAPAKATGRGWTDAEDAVIRAGYAHNLTLPEIRQQLIDAGFRERVISGISVRSRMLGCASSRVTTVWSPEEDAIVVDAYSAGVRIADIVIRLAEAGFDRPFGGIQMRAIHLGVSGDRVNRWTDAETAIAKAGLDAGKPDREILEDLRQAGFARGPTAIAKFSKKHNYNRASAPWTAAEEAVLRARYSERVPPADICQELGKTAAAVRTRAHQLGLKQRVPWAHEERQTLIDGCERGERLIDVATRIGRPYPNVSAEARRLGLSFRAPVRGSAQGQVLQ